MKKKRNLLCLLAILLAFAMLLTACDKPSKREERDEDEEEEEEEEEEREVTPGPSLLWDREETGEEEAADSEEQQTQSRTLYLDNESEQMSLTLYGDGTAVLSDAWEEVGITYTREGTSITLYNPDGEPEYGTMQPDGSIQFDSLDTPFVPVEAPGYVPSELPDEDELAPPVSEPFTAWSVEGLYNYHLVGYWGNSSNSAMSLEFDGVQYVTYTLGGMTGTGEYHFDGENLEIVTQDNQLLTGDMDWEGDVWLDGFDGWFIADREDYFKENDLDPNWFADGFPYLADAGVRYYFEDGSQYEVRPSEWEIIQNSEQNTGDGFRNLDYTMYCGFLPEQNPQLDGEYAYGCQFGVFDAYTGYMLTIDSTYYDAALDAYVYEYTSNGRQIRLECGYDTQWENDVDGYEFRLTVNLSLRLPDNYDGVRIVAIGSKPTFAEQAEGYVVALRPYDRIDDIVGGLVFKVK